MKYHFLLFSMLVMGLVWMPLCAQDDADGEEGETKSGVEAVDEAFVDIQNTVEALKKLKISGYIHAQYQSADTMGNSLYSIGNYSSGAFAPGSDNRFIIRRARLKATYTEDLASFVLQIDASERGVIIRDAYTAITEPWLRNFTITAGIFDRPFGYEIGYSSSLRESPERSRLFQTLFPAEKDLGVQLGIAFPEDEGILGYFNLKAGIFNGMRSDASENDNNKDFIGHFGFQLPFSEAGLAVDGGVSLYSGNVTSRSPVVYTMASGGGRVFVRDSSAHNINKNFERVDVGGDMEIYYDLPVLGGFALRGEYIAGTQPCSLKSASFYNPTGADSVFVRKVHGFYMNYIQNVGIANQFVLKYDVFDPNEEVEGSDIGKPGSNLTAADIKYSTWGLGWIYHWNANVKLTAYYELVHNEKVNTAASGSLASYREDVKDNVLTLRVQYKF